MAKAVFRNGGLIEEKHLNSMLNEGNCTYIILYYFKFI